MYITTVVSIKQLLQSIILFAEWLVVVVFFTIPISKEWKLYFVSVPWEATVCYPTAKMGIFVIGFEIVYIYKA